MAIEDNKLKRVKKPNIPMMEKTRSPNTSEQNTSWYAQCTSLDTSRDTELAKRAT